MLDVVAYVLRVLSVIVMIMAGITCFTGLHDGNFTLAGVATCALLAGGILFMLTILADKLKDISQVLDDDVCELLEKQRPA